MNPFEIQGHRGARGLRPENTLPSFEFALDVGVHSIETDVHLTTDDVPVLFHDSCLNDKMCRLAGSGAPPPATRPFIRQLSLAQLRAYQADGKPDPARFPEQRTVSGRLTDLWAPMQGLQPFSIPTVADLFAFVAAYTGDAGQKAGKTTSQREHAATVILDLELKHVPFFPQIMGEPGLLERRIVETIRQANRQGRSRVRSFDHRSLVRIEALEPALTTAVLMAETAPVSPGQLARAAGATIYCPDYRFLDEDLVRRAHDDGLRVLPWTVNDPTHWQQLLSWGVDGITTDFPDRLTAALAGVSV